MSSVIDSREYHEDFPNFILLIGWFVECRTFEQKLTKSQKVDIKTSINIDFDVMK